MNSVYATNPSAARKFAFAAMHPSMSWKMKPKYVLLKEPVYLLQELVARNLRPRLLVSSWPHAPSSSCFHADAAVAARACES